ncbi:MAG TPA: protein kinase [Bryobacteraceae bacterium]|nr:protein kinase [Bryobacteraceae bacterium]
MAFQIGQRVGDYEVVDVLGFGGMGQVYKVQNVISKRVEAMKVLLPNLEGDTQLAERFMQEIEVQAKLDHPNIVALHTAQRVGNQLVMVIEFVEGRMIDALLKNGPLPVDQAIDYTMQVLAALTYAHGRGIIHRDIKPANMIVTPDGTVKLMDFGIARIADRRLTQTGLTVGSLYYMSPEQINDPQNVDARADLYSVGVSLYQMVTGTRPFEGESDYSIMSAHVSVQPVPPMAIDPRLPEALNDIILMAIAKERERRFQTAEAFRRALDTVAGSVIAAAPLPVSDRGTVMPAASAAVAPPPPLPTPATLPPPRAGHRGLYMAVGGVAVVAVLAIVAWQGPRFLRSSEAAPAAGSIAPASSAPAQPVTPAPVPVTNIPDSKAAEPAPEPAQRTPVPTAEPRQSPRTTSIARSTPEPAVQQRAQPAPVPSRTLVKPAPAPQPATAPATNAGELREQRQLLMLLGTRARALNTSLQTMRSEQARSGLGMRGDITTAQQRMEFHLDEAEASLRERDVEGAKKNLAAAEREIERLEKFLGR